jgi:hypothetical protein
MSTEEKKPEERKSRLDIPVIGKSICTVCYKIWENDDYLSQIKGVCLTCYWTKKSKVRVSRAGSSQEWNKNCYPSHSFKE